MRRPLLVVLGAGALALGLLVPTQRHRPAEPPAAADPPPVPVTSTTIAFVASFVVEKQVIPPPVLADGIPAQAPSPAVRVVTACTGDLLCTQPPPPPPPPWRWCEEWHEMASMVGWPESQGATLSYVMHRESGCQPGAYNPSGATGLLQLLGWSCPPNGCRDPWSNLSKGLDLWQSSGWCPWVLRGDPVTGRACG